MTSSKDQQNQLLNKILRFVIIIVVALAFTYIVNILNEWQQTNQPSTSTTATIVTSTNQGDPSLTVWDETLAPDYYYVTGPAEVTDRPKDGEIIMSELDELGRTGEVTAVVTYQMYDDSRGWREDIPKSENPAGWGHNKEVDIELSDGSSYHGWFWNRSHLLADSLGGHAERENLITGTRMQNVGANKTGMEGGMGYTETEARDWLERHHDGTIYYRVTPVYVDDEIIPRSVIVNIATSDNSINQRVITYNYAKGYTIDYYKGTFTKDN